MSPRIAVTLLFAACFVSTSLADDPPSPLLDDRVYSDKEAEELQLSSMLERQLVRRLQEANRRESKAWAEIRTREDWERYRDLRVEQLRDSLADLPESRGDPKTRVTGTREGDGYRVENILFESRPGLFVSANLYVPIEPLRASPGIVICHSHHNPKTEGELQDMGQLWARAGCLVLVMDQLGHGERRQHPFRSKEDFAGEFRPGRQDYYFRYNVGMQLHAVGESLIGWMAWDLMCGVDVLLSRGADPGKIILLGAVAGGGDPAAVAGAIDRRIAAVVPFNFGGPQPETRYPLPDDAEETFDYAGGGSWESTRNLRLSARDGFLPWTIVGAVAPRRLIYAHEFTWDDARDPVWKRLQTIFLLYGAPDHLASVKGAGSVSGQTAEDTHCNNIGAVHRKNIYAAFDRWFGIPIPREESRDRRPAAELQCWTPELVSELKPQPLHVLLKQVAATRMTSERTFRTSRPDVAPVVFRAAWAMRLGNWRHETELRIVRESRETWTPGGTTVSVRRLSIETDPGILVPTLLLVPETKTRPPVVVAFAQAGKRAFLTRRKEEVLGCLSSGLAVCVPDLRGTGETREDDDARGRNSTSTSLSSSGLMLGETSVGARLHDLRSVLQLLRSQPEVDGTRIGLWGDSFAAPNPAGANLAVPLDASQPLIGEPLGGTLALLGALFEPNVRAVCARGGLTGYESLLDSQFCHVPHDCLIPGSLGTSDLCDVAAALAPRSLRLERLIDGLNREAPLAGREAALERTARAYGQSGHADRFQMSTPPEKDLAAWFKAALAE